MITNERQYRIAKAELCRFEKAIEAQQRDAPSEGVAPRIYEAMGASLRSEAEQLRAQIKRYEDLRDGRVNQRELEGLRDIPTALIEARIAAGFTQKALAERLELLRAADPALGGQPLFRRGGGAPSGGRRRARRRRV